ncbi:hypothetical protein Tco_1343471 [Tanacetum coccineum]
MDTMVLSQAAMPEDYQQKTMAVKQKPYLYYELQNDLVKSNDYHCELPESYEAYRKQQHRWHLGPMQLFRLCLHDIIKSKHVEERKDDIPLFSSKKTNATLLFLHSLLHRSPNDNKRMKVEEMKSYRKKKHNRVYTKELILAFLRLTAAARSLLTAQGTDFYFLLLQGIAFFLVGLDLIGE